MLSGGKLVKFFRHYVYALRIAARTAYMELWPLNGAKVVITSSECQTEIHTSLLAAIRQHWHATFRSSVSAKRLSAIANIYMCWYFSLHERLQLRHILVQSSQNRCTFTSARPKSFLSLFSPIYYQPDDHSATISALITHDSSHIVFRPALNWEKIFNAYCTALDVQRIMPLLHIKGQRVHSSEAIGRFSFYIFLNRKKMNTRKQIITFN